LKFELLLVVNGPIIKNIDVMSRQFFSETLLNQDLESKTEILSEEDENNDLNHSVLDENEKDLASYDAFQSLKEILNENVLVRKNSSKVYKDDRPSSAIIH